MKPGRGGNIIFTAGKPGEKLPPSTPMPSLPNGDVIFRSGDGTERLRLCANGQVLVRGKPVVRDYDAYAMFCEWLGEARIAQLYPGGNDGAHVHIFSPPKPEEA